jgi:hypothetical protein
MYYIKRIKRIKSKKPTAIGVDFDVLATLGYETLAPLGF